MAAEDCDKLVGRWPSRHFVALQVRGGACDRPGGNLHRLPQADFDPRVSRTAAQPTWLCGTDGSETPVRSPWRHDGGPVEAGATRDTTAGSTLGETRTTIAVPVAGLGTSLKKESAGDEYLYDSAAVAGDMG